MAITIAKQSATLRLGRRLLSRIRHRFTRGSRRSSGLSAVRPRASSRQRKAASAVALAGLDDSAAREGPGGQIAQGLLIKVGHGCLARSVIAFPLSNQAAMVTGSDLP